MIGAAGSTLWLLGHEMRLGYRDLLGRRGGTRALIFTGVISALVFAGGIALAWTLRDTEMPVTPPAVLIADVAAAVIFSLMLSQTLASAAQTLYARGDLDLLFSAPIAPRKVLTVRFAGIALMAFAAFAMLLGPFILPMAVFGHWRWLGALVVLAALAMVASSGGLLIAVALFRLIGPRRTRTVAQIMAALIGAGFFLVGQSSNILGGQKVNFWVRMVETASQQHYRLPPGADWPLRAMLGEPLPLAVIVLGAAAIFVGVNQGLGAVFARDAAAAAGVTATGRARKGPTGAFAAGAFAATMRKELRLLWRDAALLSQVLLRVFYLLPLAFILIRNAGAQATLLLPGGAAGLCLMAGQVAGSLAWITVSAEDSPELLTASPAPLSTVLRAKLAAALAPVAVLLAIPLGVLIVLAPQVGLAATLGCAASAIASGLVTVWHGKPGKRTDFRRRGGGSFLAAIAQVIVGILIAGATALAASPWPFTPLALIPAALAAVALLLFRRTDAQVAETLRAA